MTGVTRQIVYPTLSDIPSDVSPDLRVLLENMIMLLDIAYGRQGKGTNGRFVTIKDLVTAGVVPDGRIP